MQELFNINDTTFNAWSCSLRLTFNNWFKFSFAIDFFSLSKHVFIKFKSHISEHRLQILIETPNSS